MHRQAAKMDPGRFDAFLAFAEGRLPYHERPVMAGAMKPAPSRSRSVGSARSQASNATVRSVNSEVDEQVAALKGQAPGLARHPPPPRALSL